MEQHRKLINGPVIKDPITDIFKSSTCCRKDHLVLDLIEREYDKYFEPAIKDPITAIFTSSTRCRKGHLVLDLIEREYIKYFDCFIIIYSPLHWNKCFSCSQLQIIKKLKKLYKNYNN